MKRKISLFFISLLLIQSGAFVFCLRIQQCIVKINMHQAIASPKTKFQTLIIGISKLKDYKIEEDEISINGRLYDIKSFEIKNNKAILVLLHDHKEEWIMNMIKNLIQSDNENKNSIPIQLTQMLSLLYLPVDNHFDFVLHTADSKQAFNSLLRFISLCIPIVLPPPQF